MTDRRGGTIAAPAVEIPETRRLWKLTPGRNTLENIRMIAMVPDTSE
jgi:hypothetical protein